MTAPFGLFKADSVAGLAARRNRCRGRRITCRPAGFVDFIDIVAVPI